MKDETASEGTRRTILHLDMDCFYVSVERLLDPTLFGKPVAVGGSPDGRGVVASASYEARKFGVRSAMPMGRALALCPQLLVVSSGYSKYAEFSQQVHDILNRYSPLVEMASQDEAYVDLTGTERLWGHSVGCAQRMRDDITRETKLPCSVGIATSRSVAKIASDLCKPSGFLWVPPGSEAAFLAPLPAKRLPGVGPKTEERLHEAGIDTIGDLADLGEGELTRLFGEHGRDLAKRAAGLGSDVVVSATLPKSIGAEETFERDTTDPLVLDGLLANESEKVAYRMRKEDCRASCVTLKYRYSDFETHTVARTLADPTDDEVELLKAARALLEKHRDPRRPIRLLGVTASGLLFGRRQTDLFREAELEKADRLHAAIDGIRAKHGYGAVRRAGSTGRHEAKNDKQWG